MTELDFTILEAIETEEEESEVIDLSSPEDVLIEVVGPHDDNPDNKSWGNWSIESTTVIHQENPEVTGAANYEISYGSFLDYMIQNMIDVPGAGWFVVTGITATYTKGDGWSTDDDMDFYFEDIRPATEDEIKQA